MERKEQKDDLNKIVTFFGDIFYHFEIEQVDEMIYFVYNKKPHLNFNLETGEVFIYAVLYDEYSKINGLKDDPDNLILLKYIKIFMENFLQPEKKDSIII